MTEEQMQDVIIGAVVDMSYSMKASRAGTMAGFNEFKQDQARQPGNAWMTYVQFDEVVENPYNAWACGDIPDLEEGGVYSPRGNTALYDAYAECVALVDKWLSENSWFGGKVVVMVMTDGMENASKKFSQSAVQALSRAKKEAGWEFVVFAANVEATSVAMQLGISPDRAHQYVSSIQDSHDVFAAVSDATFASRSGDPLAYSGTLRGVRSAQNTGLVVDPKQVSKQGSSRKR